MNDEIFIIFGYIASIIGIIMMFPQVYLTIKKNSTEDLSIKTVCMNFMAQLFFLPYSLYFKLYPLLVANVSIGMCDAIILTIFVRNKLV